MKEKAQANFERMQLERNIQAAMLARDQRARELEDAERDNRRKLLAANAKYNLELVSRSDRCGTFFLCASINLMIHRRHRNAKVNASRNNGNRKKTI